MGPFVGKIERIMSKDLHITFEVKMVKCMVLGTVSKNGSREERRLWRDGV